MSLDISSIIEKTKKDLFTKDRKSVIKTYLIEHPQAVLYRDINKKGVKHLRFYYIKNDQLKYNDYIEKNGNVLIEAFKKNNIDLKTIDSIKD